MGKAVEYPFHGHRYFERRDAALQIEPLYEETCMTLIYDQRAMKSVRRHILVMAIRQAEGDGNISKRQADFLREHMNGDTYEEIGKRHGCHRNTVLNQTAKACRTIKASLPNDEARELFELLLDVFGAYALSLAGYDRPE